MGARIAGIWSQLFDRTLFDLERCCDVTATLHLSQYCTRARRSPELTDNFSKEIDQRRSSALRSTHALRECCFFRAAQTRRWSSQASRLAILRTAVSLIGNRPEIVGGRYSSSTWMSGAR